MGASSFNLSHLGTYMFNVKWNKPMKIISADACVNKKFVVNQEFCGF